MSHPLRIGTFNLHHAAPPGRRFDRRGLRDAVVRLGADVLALQEVDRRSVRTRWADEAAIAARAAGLHPTFVPARRLGLFGRYGIALLTPAPPTSTEVLSLPPFGGEARVALIASVAAGDVELSVAATHLQNNPRVAVRQLGIVLERLAQRPEPRVLLGDLNAGRRLLGPMIEAAGLTPAVAAPTFPTRAPEERLDWIAVSGLSIERVEVPDVWLSDHFPLVATVA